MVHYFYFLGGSSTCEKPGIALRRTVLRAARQKAMQLREGEHLNPVRHGCHGKSVVFVFIRPVKVFKVDICDRREYGACDTPSTACARTSPGTCLGLVFLAFVVIFSFLFLLWLGV